MSATGHQNATAPPPGRVTGRRGRRLCGPTGGRTLVEWKSVLSILRNPRKMLSRACPKQFRSARNGWQPGIPLAPFCREFHLSIMMPFRSPQKAYILFPGRRRVRQISPSPSARPYGRFRAGRKRRRTSRSGQGAVRRKGLSGGRRRGCSRGFLCRGEGPAAGRRGGRGGLPSGCLPAGEARSGHCPAGRGRGRNGRVTVPCARATYSAAPRWIPPPPNASLMFTAGSAHFFTRRSKRSVTRVKCRHRSRSFQEQTVKYSCA